MQWYPNIIHISDIFSLVSRFSLSFSYLHMQNLKQERVQNTTCQWPSHHGCEVSIGGHTFYYVLSKVY